MIRWFLIDFMMKEGKSKRWNGYNIYSYMNINIYTYFILGLCIYICAYLIYADTYLIIHIFKYMTHTHTHTHTLPPPPFPHTRARPHARLRARARGHVSHARAPSATSAVQYGNTPLHLAAEKGRSSVAAALLDKSADVNAKTNVSAGARV